MTKHYTATPILPALGMISFACLQNAAGAGVYINSPASEANRGDLVSAATFSGGGPQASGRAKGKHRPGGASGARRNSRSSAAARNRAQSHRLPVLAATQELTADTYHFNLTHSGAGGFVLEVQKPGEAMRTMAWGRDGLGQSLIVTTMGEATPDSFNQLRLAAFSGLADAQLSFSDLVFSSPDLSVSSGEFFAGTVGAGSNAAEQSLVTDGEMAGSTWSLSGSLAFNRPVGAAPSEEVRFTIEARKQPGEVAGVSPVPEPSSTAVLGLAVAGVLARRRR